jgi:uncharacterized protein (DUF849 family)
MEKLIINFTPTGMIPTKNQTPYVPIKPEEIIDDVKRAYNAGISMVHLHIRDENTEEPCYKKETYGRIIFRIREYAPDLVICVSTSGRTFSDFTKRSDVLSLTGDLKPDMGSLTLSSVNFNTSASINEPEMIQKLAKTMLENGIKPELEAFDLGMINYAKYLIRKGMLSSPYYFNLIFGNIACAQANLLSIGLMISELPDESIVSLGGIGNWQLSTNSLAISMGYGVRVGIEDNIWYDKERTILAKNSMLIERIHSLSKANEQKIMTPLELRRVLKLKPGNGEYGI